MLHGGQLWMWMKVQSQFRRGMGGVFGGFVIIYGRYSTNEILLCTVHLWRISSKWDIFASLFFRVSAFPRYLQIWDWRWKVIQLIILSYILVAAVPDIIAIRDKRKIPEMDVTSIKCKILQPLCLINLGLNSPHSLGQLAQWRGLWLEELYSVSIQSLGFNL